MKRSWVERAKVWVPSGDEPRCAGKDAANVRRYIDDELGIILSGERSEGKTAMSQSTSVPQDRSAVDSWHTSSAFE